MREEGTLLAEERRAGKWQQEETKGLLKRGRKGRQS